MPAAGSASGRRARQLEPDPLPALPPILWLADTAIGVFVELVAAWLGLHAAAGTGYGRHRGRHRAERPARVRGPGRRADRADDRSAGISYYAIDHDLTLKQAALAKGVPEELYYKVVIPINLTRPGTADLPPAGQKP